MPTISENIASTLETHRMELMAMLEALPKATLSGLKAAEVAEHMNRAKHAVGLARATLLGAGEG
jgi:ribonuclease HI